MTMPKAELIAIDQAFINRMYGENLTLHGRLLNQFVGALQQQIDDLDRVLEDPPRLASEVHRVAGQLANLGFTSLAQFARETEMQLKADPEDAFSRYAELRGALAQLSEQLEVVSDE